MSESSNPVEEFRSSDEVIEAVRRLQWMAGLPMTGQLDARTTEQQSGEGHDDEALEHRSSLQDESELGTN